MKKFLKIIFSILFVVLTLVAACGCNLPSKEDVTPTELGAPEGLYLYNGNYRSLTDGSNVERLIDIVQLGGTEYAASEYSVEKHAYIRIAHKCYFVLSTENERWVYLFDYKEKSGRAVCSLPHDESIYVATSSNCYFYVETDSVNLLFDAEGNMLCDKINGLFDDDLLYAVDEYERAYEWFYNGKYHRVDVKDAWFFDMRDYHRFGGYVYFLKSTETIVIDLDTGVMTMSELLNDKENFPYNNKQYHLHGERNEYTYYADGTLYLLAVYYNDIPNDDSSEWHTYLYGIKDGEATMLHYFGNPRWGCSIIGVESGNIYLEAGYNGRTSTHYKYNIESGRTNKVRKVPDFKKSSTPSNYIKVGEYEFFTESVQYTVPDGFLGFRFESCVYMWRRKGKDKEIMQYSFASGKFYDDICEF